MPPVPSHCGEGQAFWRKKAFAMFSRVNKTLTQRREDISGKGSSVCKGPEVYKNN